MSTRSFNLETSGGTVPCLVAVPEAGSGPGLVVVGGSPSACAQMAEEGYVVLAPETAAGDVGDATVASAAAALADLPEHGGRIAGVGFGAGGAAVCRAADASGFAAVVAYEFVGEPGDAAAASCPVAIHLADSAAGAAPALTDALSSHDDARVHVYPGAEAGFADPGHRAHDPRLADIAHTRTLDLLRPLIGPHYDFVALFAEHARHEFETRDVDAIMPTMVAEPYVNHVPTLTGGVGHDMLKRFYKYHFVTQNSESRDSTPISYTVGGNRVVIESVVRFRHDFVIDRMYPGIEPTGRTVELPLVLIVKFRGPKLAHEHIYWDQGSALAQIGLIDASALPVAGAEQAAKLLDETRPSNELMAESWKTSEGKPI